MSNRDTCHENDVWIEAENMAPAYQIYTTVDDEIFCCSIATDIKRNVIYSILIDKFPIELYADRHFFVCSISINAILF